MELAAMRWLAFEKRCHAVLFERTPDQRFGYRPDVIGLTRDRYLLEVEIKRTVHDFRANSKKAHIRTRDIQLDRWPRQFWFLVPSDILDQVRPLCPKWAGLASLYDGYNLMVVVPAPANPGARRLSTKQLARMFHLLSNQLMACEGMWRSKNLPWEPCYWLEGKPHGAEYMI